MPAPEVDSDDSGGHDKNSGNLRSHENDPQAQKRQDWPWETDETKRYPDKDPASLTPFERRYPADQAGAELNDNSRLFRVYQDRMNELDDDTVLGWSETINFLLIFAGLFSTILTAFLLELSKKLEPDHSEYSSLSLFVLASNASGKNVTLPDDADPREFKPKTSHRATNVLWFASLTLSLLVSMLAILTKQWIGVFVSRMRMPVRHLRRWAHRHRAYRDGLDRWHLNAFVSGLSVLLHVALLLFFVGLIVYTHTLDVTVFITVTVISTLGALIYVGTTLAPLFDGTCPTATPLLFHAHDIIFWVLARLGWYRDHTSPPFAEDCVLPDRNTGDVETISWVLSNLAGDQDISVALDAVAELPSDAPSNRLAASELVYSGTLHRLEWLVKGRLPADLEAHAAEIARAIRSMLRVAVAPENRALVVGLAKAARMVRTHDVAVLSVLLWMHAEGVPDMEIYEPLAELFPSDRSHPHLNRHLHHHVGQLGGAFQSWVEYKNQRPSIPVSRHTRDILFRSLSIFPLHTSFCISLVLTFCRDSDDADRWIELTNLNVERDIKVGLFVDHREQWLGGNFSSRGAWGLHMSNIDWETPLEWPGDRNWSALQAWATIYVALEVQSNHPGPNFRDLAAHCCLLLLERCRFQGNFWPELPALPLSVLRTVLAPLTSNVADTPGIISSALALFAMADKHTAHHQWNAIDARILFCILERLHCNRQTSEDDDMWNQIAIHKVLPLSPSQGLEHLIFRIRSNNSTHEVIKKSMLNVLTPRITRGGSNTSIWRLMVSSTVSLDRPDDTYISHELRTYAAILSEQLAVLGIFDPTIDTGGMFEQLLGNGYGLKFMTGTVYLSFETMRHVASSAPVQWAELRPALMVSEWWGAREVNEPDSPASAIAAVEAEPLCADCIVMLEGMRDAHAEAATRIIDDEERLRRDKESWFEQRVGCESG